jgi:hypothetical protein
MRLDIFNKREITLSKSQLTELVESIVDYVEGNKLHKLTVEEQQDSFTCTIYNLYIKKYLKEKINVEKEKRILDLEIRRLQKKLNNLELIED